MMESLRIPMTDVVAALQAHGWPVTTGAVFDIAGGPSLTVTPRKTERRNYCWPKEIGHWIIVGCSDPESGETVRREFASVWQAAHQHARRHGGKFSVRVARGIGFECRRTA